MTYILVNEAYGNEQIEISYDELIDLFGDHETELVVRVDGIYEVNSGNIVAVVA